MRDQAQEGAEERTLASASAPAVARRSSGELSYEVGLEPGEVIERLGELDGVRAYPKGRFPDLGDLVAPSRFVAEVDGDRFRLACGCEAPERRAVSIPGQPVEMRGFGRGGGMIADLWLVGEMRRVGARTRVDLYFEQSHSARSLLRLAGFTATMGTALVWLGMGSGRLFDRLLFFAVFLLFTAPVVFVELRRLGDARRDRLELYSLVERLLGPEVLPTGERTPYRERSALGPGR